MSEGPRITVVAPATEEYPRQSEGTIVELADGSLLLVWQEFWRGDKGDLDSDFWPSRLAAMVSRDGGHAWGGRRIVEHYKAGLALSEAYVVGGVVGESWEVSVEPDFPSIVATSGEHLRDVIAADPVAWLGEAVAERSGGQTPLLVKLSVSGCEQAL